MYFFILEPWLYRFDFQASPPVNGQSGITCFAPTTVINMSCRYTKNQGCNSQRSYSITIPKPHPSASIYQRCVCVFKRKSTKNDANHVKEIIKRDVIQSFTLCRGIARCACVNWAHQILSFGVNSREPNIMKNTSNFVCFLLLLWIYIFLYLYIWLEM